ncbi:tumor necrosis factor ligand superfamily member 9 [Discoglossus pictus]
MSFCHSPKSIRLASSHQICTLSRIRTLQGQRDSLLHSSLLTSGGSRCDLAVDSSRDFSKSIGCTMTSTVPPVKPGDIESPGVSSKRTRSLDYCLVISVLLLTLALGSLCTLYLMLDRPRLEHSVKEHRDHQTTSAHLMPNNVLLQNGTFSWLHTSGIGSVFVGSDFQYEDDDLIVRKDGLYFVYSQLALTCKSLEGCPPKGSVTLTVNKKPEETSLLTLNVQLASSAKQGLTSSFSGTLHLFYAGDRLSSKLCTDFPHKDWQLHPMDTFLGLFRVSEIISSEPDQ